MEKRGCVVIAAVLLISIGLATWQALRVQEPVYRNRQLSDWVVNGDHDASAEAVRAAGTNAIPTLLRMLRAKDSSVDKFIRRLPKPFPIEISYELNHPMAFDQNVRAAQAFANLGPTAQDAVPALIEMLRENPSSWWFQAEVARALGGIGPAAHRAVPSLIQLLNNTNKQTRLLACQALGQIHAEAASVVPALIQAAHDPYLFVRADTAEALAAFGTESRSSVPILIELLSDQEREVSTKASKALVRIDPEAAAKAGINTNGPDL